MVWRQPPDQSKLKPPYRVNVLGPEIVATEVPGEDEGVDTFPVSEPSDDGSIKGIEEPREEVLCLFTFCRADDAAREPGSNSTRSITSVK
jgi:hypothetical protein